MSSELPVTTPKKIIKALNKMGLVFQRQKGSHIFLRHPESPGKYVNVPYHNKDLKKGTLKGIMKQVEQMGLNSDEFIKLL